MREFTLILEYNHRADEPQGPLGSVWIFAGDGRGDLARRLPGWAKIVGPIDYNLASEVQSALKEFFVQNGVDIIDDAVSD